MNGLSILLLVLLAVWFVLSVIHMAKRKSCGWGCSMNCMGNCDSCQKRCSGQKKRGSLK